MSLSSGLKQISICFIRFCGSGCSFSSLLNDLVYYVLIEISELLQCYKDGDSDDRKKRRKRKVESL